jgi:hypothetical protein
MTRTGAQRVQKGSNRKLGMTAVFKYYIHDTAKGYALEMSGPLTEACVSELSCCWQTAKTTLKGRTLTLDLRRLTALDEPARQWLASMAQDGAKYLPESFLLDTVAGLPGGELPETPETSKQSLFVRLFRFAPKPAR